MSRGPFQPGDEAPLREALARYIAGRYAASASAAPSSGGWRIPIDIFETADHLVVIAALPGATADDLEISTTEKTLTIRGRIPGPADEPQARQWTWYLEEIPRGAFTRTIDLPVEVNPEAARATFQDGLLRLDLPAAEKPRRLTIHVEAEGRR